MTVILKGLRSWAKPNGTFSWVNRLDYSPGKKGCLMMFIKIFKLGGEQ